MAVYKYADDGPFSTRTQTTPQKGRRREEDREGKSEREGEKKGMLTLRFCICD